MCVIINSLL